MNDHSTESWKDTLVHASRPVRYAATAALAVLALFLLVMTIDSLHNWGHPDSDGPATITVTGDGTATAVPDTATVSFMASATAADVTTAEKNMTTSNDAALTAIKALGISADDITTTSYNVNPHYKPIVCPNDGYCGNSETSGYDVSESVDIKIHDTTKVASVLAALTKANITNVSGPNFGVDDTQAVQAQARAQAVQKAQADAVKLAKQLGVHLGKIYSFSDDTSNNGSQPMYKDATAMSAAAAPSTPTISPGQNTYTDSVSITYEIN